MASVRRSVQDFMAQVNARTVAGGNTYSTVLNSDGSVQVSKNGVVFSPKVYWGMGTGVAVTNLNISGDSIDVSRNDGTTGSGDAQLFINSLT